MFLISRQTCSVPDRSVPGGLTHHVAVIGRANTQSNAYASNRPGAGHCHAIRL